MKFKDDNQRAHDQNHIRLTENQGLEIVHIAIKQEILVFLVGTLRVHVQDRSRCMYTQAYSLYITKKNFLFTIRGYMSCFNNVTNYS